MHEIVMPQLSDTVTEGKLLRWLVEKGSRIAEGDPIAEVEIDKANLEIEASASGRVAKLCATPGDDVAAGAVLLVLED